jgi:diadenosine tetraphosphate (Ap4A) HIT family hydrolase
MKQCNLCDTNLEPVIAESAYWRLVLNRNQNLLGKCFLALRRHLEVVPELSPAEWADLHEQLAQATQVLALAFQPDHFNYAFLQNQDRHIHLHIIPRYDEPRVFAGVTFDDSDYPSHYAVPAPSRYLTQGQFTALAEQLRQLFAQTAVGAAGVESEHPPSATPSPVAASSR